MRVVPGRATSHRAIVVNSIEATHYGHCRPSRQDVSPAQWDAFGDVDVFVDEVLAELTAMARDGAPGCSARGPSQPLAGATRCARR